MEHLVEPALALAQQWSNAASAGASKAENAASDTLAQLVADPAGLDLAVAFVDRVARPEDPAVAARELAHLPAEAAAAFLTPSDRALFAVGQKVAPLAPEVVVPAARMRLRQLVGHLVVDAEDAALTKRLARARSEGYRLNINLLGEAVLGEKEAASRVQRTIALLRRGDVDYVSIKVSSLVSQISHWDSPGTVARVLTRLRPLYREAVRRGAFVNLDMEEYHDLDLTIEVFEALLAEEEFADLDAGIVLQAYLPDAPAALERIIEISRRRVAAGGKRVKVRLVKGANLAMERVEAEQHDWPQAPHVSKAASDATYVRMMERALQSEVAAVLRIGVAGHNLPHLALAHLLATERGVSDALDIEMLQGMAPAQSRAVRETIGRTVLLYTPVVAKADFDVAVSYLVRRLEENASPENYLHQSLTQEGQQEARERFVASVRGAASVTTTPRRRGEPAPVPPLEEPFRNAADADPSVAIIREKATAAMASRPDLTPTSAQASSLEEVDDVVALAQAAAEVWGQVSAPQRAAVLADVADRLEARRWEILSVMAHEAGKTAGEGDPEVTEAIDFARYYARSALALADVDATFTPVPVTLVTPPWNFPVAICAGGLLAALAAGSAVILKPSPSATRCGEVVADVIREALAAAGHDPETLQVLRVPEDEVGKHLITHDGVDQVILTGAMETARLFADWRAERPGGPAVYAETSGKNAIIVTPSADIDLAVADVVRSAFGHAGQKCSAASLVILVGSMATSRRFRNQLLDAVSSLRVGVPQDLGTGMGPVIEAPSGKLERALTTLEPGERWAIAPQQLPAPAGSEQWQGHLWRPGVRSGVRPGSWFHLTECFGPVLGVMTAATLTEAIDIQNQVAFGLTGGLQSLDAQEIAQWLEEVEVGNAYINRHITGAIVQRQSFGGWKASVMGPGAKAGGPGYVAQLGTWSEDAERWSQRAALTDDAIDLAEVRAADAAWAAQALAGSDPTGLASQENTLRYRPFPAITVRAAAGSSRWDLRRALAAAETVGVQRVVVSVDPSLPVTAEPADSPACVVSWRTETEEDFAARVAQGTSTERIRWIGARGESAPSGTWSAAVQAEVTLIDAPVFTDPELELRTVTREQAISRTKHRYGHLHA
nr:bifunctional proline dehydrogenase/L-glutamate gamma-semialdehyde dehydrogenase [Serinibacter salmoneus]